MFLKECFIISRKSQNNYGSYQLYILTIILGFLWEDWAIVIVSIHIICILFLGFLVKISTLLNIQNDEEKLKIMNKLTSNIKNN